MKRTFLEELDVIAPFLVFAIARDRKRPITQESICQRTGFSVEKVSRIASLQSWASVTVEDADAFRIACNVTRANHRRQLQYIKRTLNPEITTNGLAALRKRPAVIQERFRKLLKK